MCEWVETAGRVTSLGPHAGTGSSNREGLFKLVFITPVTVMKNKMLIGAKFKKKSSNNASLIFYICFFTAVKSSRKDN